MGQGLHAGFSNEIGFWLYFTVGKVTGQSLWLVGSSTYTLYLDGIVGLVPCLGEASGLSLRLFKITVQDP